MYYITIGIAFLFCAVSANPLNYEDANMFDMLNLADDKRSMEGPPRLGREALDLDDVYNELKRAASEEIVDELLAESKRGIWPFRIPPRNGKRSDEQEAFLHENDNFENAKTSKRQSSFLHKKGDLFSLIQRLAAARHQQK